MAAICGRRTSAAEAPVVWGAETEGPERLRLHFHGAELERSFQTVGIMDPYVTVSIDGKVVHRTRAATWAHKHPTWNSTFAVRAKTLPTSVTVAVWNQNRMRKDVLCGSVTVPLADEMGMLADKEFALTKRSKQTGKIRLSLNLTGRSGSALRSSGSTLGAEMDHIVQWIEEAGQSNNPLMRGRSLELAELSTISEEGENSQEGRPTLLSGQVAMKAPLEAGFRNNIFSQHRPVRADDPCSGSMLSLGSGLPAEAGAKADVAAVEGEAGSPEALAGHWECTDTFGLEEFLIAAGLGAFQRRLAMSARWPSWDFKILSDRIKFINHSALGDLNEEILLDGAKYTWRDGKLNLLTCTSNWTTSADGGCLRIWRAHEKASFYEDRVVSGDTLTFTMFAENGCQWGRVFKRSN